MGAIVSLLMALLFLAVGAFSLSILEQSPSVAIVIMIVFTVFGVIVYKAID